MKISCLLILMPVSIAIALSGLFIFLRPEAAIEFQKKFYEKINWRIEPISMPKEIRNTRIMGAFLLVAALVTIILSLTCY